MDEQRDEKIKRTTEQLVNNTITTSEFLDVFASHSILLPKSGN